MKNLLTIVLLISCTLGIAQKPWTLEDCITYAKDHNIDILRQKLENKKSKEDITISKGNFLPDLNFSGSQNYNLGSSLDISTGVGQSESRSNSFRLSSSLSIFNGFRNKYQLQQSNLNFKRGEVNVEKISQEVALAITDNYLQILFNKEIVEVAKEQVLISEKEVDRLYKLYNDGFSSKNELLEIQSTHALDKKELLLAENSVKNSLIKLKELLSVDDIDNFDIQNIDNTTVVKNILPNDINNLFSDALSNNPLIKTTSIDIQINKKEVQIAKSNFYPQINFNYSLGSSYFHIQGTEDVVFNPVTETFVENGFFTQLKNNAINFIGINANIPIFNRFLNRSNFDKAKIDLEIAQLNLKNQKKELKFQVEIALNDVKVAAINKKTTEISKITQEEAFRIVQTKYTKGFLSSYEFLESKSRYIQSQSDFLKAKYEYYFKNKYLDYLIGTSK